MAKIEEYLLLAKQLGREGFEAKHPWPFVVWRSATAGENEWSFKTQTGSALKALTRLIDSDLQLAPEAQGYLTFPITKSASNPWKDRISVGRARNNDVVVLDNSVSKLHAHFSAHGQFFSITDAGSRNGTKVNDKTLTGGDPVALRLNDKVVFGSIETLFVDALWLFDFLTRHMQKRTRE